LTLSPELDFNLEGAPLLSKSAALRVGVAIQYVLAKLAGARLLMVDEVDMLDPVNRRNFIKFLIAVKADFDTIMAFTTAASASPAPMPEVAMWWVADGGVEAL
jgi:energy-coupling factor transporter ATP-binding protein EcfA2